MTKHAHRTTLSPRSPRRWISPHGIALAVALLAGPSFPAATVLAAGPVTYSGPLVITKGGTYSGNWESQNPKVAAVSVQTGEPVVIENANIRGRGDLISGFGNRLTVRNVNGYGLNPNVVGWKVGKFVNAEEFISIDIENSSAENTQGVYFRAYRGKPGNGDTVRVLRNRFRNINGFLSAGKETYNHNIVIGRAHMLMFNDVRRIPRVEIAWNEIINDPGKSLVEENINLYASGGMPDSPILIHDNYIQGAYNAYPSSSTDYTGGGIILGDGAEYHPAETGYTRVYGNQIVSTTNQGVALAGGTENHVYDNRIVSSGLLANGSRIAAQNVGMYLWNISAAAAKAVPMFTNNSMSNNFVAWTKFADDGTASTYPWWFPDCGKANNICDGNISGGVATLDMEQQEYKSWLAKLAAQRIRIGRVN